MSWQEIMAQICHRWSEILGDTLTGIYVHGSIAFGCFQPQKSDIDFLTVVSRPPALPQKREMIRCLIELSAFAPEKGIEMSVLLEEDCRAFAHPMPYEMHYSPAHHPAYLADMDNTLARLHGTDPDLAAHITVTRAVGIALAGPAPQDLFAPVPEDDYLDSIWQDVENAAEDVIRDPVYILLNLCRVLAYAREGLVLSKAGGGEWGLQTLPEKDRPMLSRALECYRTGGKAEFDEAALKILAGDILQMIVTERQRKQCG